MCFTDCCVSSEFVQTALKRVLGCLCAAMWCRALYATCGMYTFLRCQLPTCALLVCWCGFDGGVLCPFFCVARVWRLLICKHTEHTGAVSCAGPIRLHPERISACASAAGRRTVGSIAGFLNRACAPSAAKPRVCLCAGLSRAPLYERTASRSAQKSPSCPLAVWLWQARMALLSAALSGQTPLTDLGPSQSAVLPAQCLFPIYLYSMSVSADNARSTTLRSPPLHRRVAPTLPAHSHAHCSPFCHPRI